MILARHDRDDTTVGRAGTAAPRAWHPARLQRHSRPARSGQHGEPTRMPWTLMATRQFPRCKTPPASRRADPPWLTRRRLRNPQTSKSMARSGQAIVKALQVAPFTRIRGLRLGVRHRPGAHVTCADARSVAAFGRLRTVANEARTERSPPTSLRDLRWQSAVACGGPVSPSGPRARPRCLAAAGL